MKFRNPQTLASISSLIEASFIGEADFPIFGINEIHRVEKGDIVFVDHPKYYEKALNSSASVVLIDKEVDCPEGKSLIISNNPFDDFNKITKHFFPFSKSLKPINSQIHYSTTIQPNVFIGKNVQIGKNCIIHSNVSIYDDSIIGDNVEIHANTVIGSNAFYYQKKDGKYSKMYSCGRVVIHNNVEVGANCTIDKGVTADTIIGEGSKLDNLVHIGHDTVIGKNCLLAAQVGIAGVTTLKDNVILWGQVGVISDVIIEENVTVLAQSGVANSLKANKTYFGSPAIEARKKMKQIAVLKKLSDS